MTIPATRMALLMRKIRSSLLRAGRGAASLLRVSHARLFNRGSVIPWSCRMGAGSRIRVTDGGRLVLGENVSIGAYSDISVQFGIVEIGAGSFIGQGCILAAKESITIGEQALIAEYVSIRDQDHAIDADGPARHDGFVCAPISIGAGTWIGAKASVLRGTTIGAGAIVGAHALVKGAVPAHAVAVGIPARVVRQREAPR